MTNQNQTQNLDIDALLDGDIEGLLERKEFAPLPKGSYLFTLGWKKATMDDDGFIGVIIELQLVRPLEFANPKDAEQFEEGGIFHGEEAIKRNMRCYFVNNKGEGSSYGQGTVREICQRFIEAGLVEANSEGKFPISYVLDCVTGFEVIARVDHRKDKNDKSKVFDDYKDIVPNTGEAG